MSGIRVSYTREDSNTSLRYQSVMSKITFRADDDLVRRLEEFDASKSEVMREALRIHLEGAERETNASDPESATVDDALADRIDELIEQRVDEHLSRFARNDTQDVNVNITVDGDTTESAGSQAERATEADTRKTPRANTAERAQTGRKTCGQCGDEMSAESVYCPNCGEKASHRVFCDCGDEIRSDWAFCPSCGRRTPAADVLDRA